MSNNLASLETYPKPWLDRPDSQEIKAIVILLHGLNLRPQKMDDWAEVLKKRNALIVRLALYGHTENETDMRAAHENIWRKQIDEAILMAQAESHLRNNVPIYFLGFSLGALVGLEAQARSVAKNPPLEKMALIAPAVAVPWYSKAAIDFCAMFGNGFLVPARSPHNYRVHKGTSVAAYRSLFSLKKSLEDLKYKNANIKTLVILERYDELVSSTAIKKIIREFRLGLWETAFVNNRVARDNYGFRHLLVDKESLGDKLWQDMSAKVIKHFDL